MSGAGLRRIARLTLVSTCFAQGTQLATLEFADATSAGCRRLVISTPALGTFPRAHRGVAGRSLAAVSA